MKETICFMIIMFQHIMFGVLALVAELTEVHWLAIIFVILEFLTLSAPTFKRLEDKLREKE